jgi:hypothetical protein
MSDCRGLRAPATDAVVRIFAVVAGLELRDPIIMSSREDHHSESRAEACSTDLTLKLNLQYSISKTTTSHCFLVIIGQANIQSTRLLNSRT